jgi:tetratricopeptide (TPR) repeat protein
MFFKHPFIKHSIFSLLIVTAFFGGLEVVLAMAGVRPLILTEDPFVGFAENVPQFVTDTRPDGTPILKTARNKRNLFNYQEFPVNKDDNSYRIFCMGGSTTYGRPYFDDVSFCGWLRAYLQAADPHRNWEVINAGGVSFASYRVTRLMNELKQYQPDLFIVYSGQNEFLEQRSYGGLIDQPDWLLNLNATLSGTRVYTALARLIETVQPDSLQQAKARSQLSGEVDEILNHTIGPQSYQRDDTLKQHILTHYRLNLLRMVKIARSVDADILFVQPAVNLKDMSPFKSTHRDGLDAPTLQAWQDLYDRAGELAGAGDGAGALARYREALALDDRYAELHFRMGQVLFSLGRYAEAEQAFQRAVEEDIAPLRMLAAMQRSVAEVAAAEEVPLVDFPEILRAAYRRDYPYTVFGKEYFVDHVHTNMEGYRLLGLALFDHLVEAGVAHPDGTWNAARREAVRETVIASLDPRDEGGALLNLGKVLEWAGKFDEAYAAFQRSLEILGPSPMLFDRLARTAYALGQHDKTLEYLRASLTLDPRIPGVHAKLATILGKQGKTDEAIKHSRAELEITPDNFLVHTGLAKLLEKQGDDSGARQHYEKALQLNPELESARVRLVYLLVRQEQYDEAKAHCEELLRINPQQYRAHTALGLILKFQGEDQQAIRHFSEALRLEPNDSTARENLQQLQAGRPVSKELNS